MDEKEQKRLLRAIVSNDKEYDEIISTLPNDADNDMIIDIVIKYRNQELKEHLRRKPQNIALGFFSIAMVFLLITMIMNKVY